MNGLGDRASIWSNAQYGDLAWWISGFLPAGLSAWEVEDESCGITLGQAWVVGDSLVHAATWSVVTEATIHANGSVAGQVESTLWCHRICLRACRGGDVEC